MDWILAAYLLGLIYLSVNREKAVDLAALRSAWGVFIAIPALRGLFVFIKMGQTKSPRDLMQTEFWEHAFCWGLLAISLFWMLRGIIPPEKPPSKLR